MSLYRIKLEDEWNYVEADTFAKAIRYWQDWMNAEGVFEKDPEPEAIKLVGRRDEPVIRAPIPQDAEEPVA
jgi:hypothetical protein